jgi:Skp family chaperone for outer membrane proteins
MIHVAALGAVCLAGTAAIRDQITAGTGALRTVKIGLVDIQQAIWATAEGNRASEELKSQFAPRQKELDVLAHQIDDLREQLTAGSTLGTAEVQHQRRQRGEHLVAQYDRKQRELNEDSQAAQAEVVQRISGKLMEVLNYYAREHGYIAVFNSSSQNSGIVYKSIRIELTQDIVCLYDQAHSKESAVPETKPTTAAPKPTATLPPDKL